MADTPKGETGAEVTPKNDTPTPPTPPAAAAVPEEKKTEDSEIEKLRKEKEQIEMRANQLANQLKAKEDAETASKAKELEEQNEFKTLYEQEKSKREEIEREREADEQKKAVAETTKNVLADYSDDVKALAEDTGLSLDDVTEAAVAEFKAKLDKIQTRVGTPSVTPNNPGVASGQKEYTREELFLILEDPVKRDAYYRAKNGVTAMMMEPPKG